jgi:hypothetical protein
VSILGLGLLSPAEIPRQRRSVNISRLVVINHLPEALSTSVRDHSRLFVVVWFELGTKCNSVYFTFDILAHQLSLFLLARAA